MQQINLHFRSSEQTHPSAKTASYKILCLKYWAMPACRNKYHQLVCIPGVSEAEEDCARERTTNIRYPTGNSKEKNCQWKGRKKKNKKNKKKKKPRYSSMSH